MKIRFSYKSGLFFISLFLALTVQAETIECIGSYYGPRCLACPNGSLACGGENIFVRHNNTPLDHLKVVVTRNGVQTTHALRNPPGNISDYITVQSNEWVQKNIPGGLKFGDILEVAQEGGYGLDSGTPYYKGWKSDDMLGYVGDLKPTQPSKSQSLVCWYTAQVNAVVAAPDFCEDSRKNTSLGQKRKSVCYGNVRCQLKGQTMVGPAACKPLETTVASCPTATDCAKENISKKDFLIYPAQNEALLLREQGEMPSYKPTRSGSSGGSE